jgi:hypothetical protein
MAKPIIPTNVNRASLEARFWSKVDKTPGHGPRGDCWVWTARLDRDGYGQIRVYRSLRKPAHVIAYELIVEPVVPGMLVLHSCDNPPCCNPSHLSQGTPQQNMDDKHARNRQRYLRGTECPQSVFNKETVLQIRHRYIPYKVPLQSLADEYEVSLETVRKVVKRITYRHIP